MRFLFLSLLCVHILQALVLYARRIPEEDTRRRPTAQLIIQVPLFFMACFIAPAGVFSRGLISPTYIGLGVLAGHIIFVLSLLITHQSFEDAASHLFDFGALWNFAMDSPIVLTRFLSVAVAEEMIWRAAAQPLAIELTGSTWAGLLAVAVGFSVVHRHFFENAFLVSAEFVGFAILLGVLYDRTGSFILVTVIHAVRDIEIAYLEYLIKVDELGDPELAAKEIERAYHPKAREHA